MLALILTPIGNPRPGLCLFLRSLPGLELLDGADLLGAELLIFDAYMPGYSNWSQLCQAKARLSAKWCIAIVSEPQQITYAYAAGADHVLLVGFSAAEFLLLLQNL
ncbi:MAG: hypothetical protein JW981_07685 [Anaerolineae bacterium]|nr:hypothetical protein [Anaerolineae bacterium]